jgi:hypothetical protein
MSKPSKVAIELSEMIVEHFEAADAGRRRGMADFGWSYFNWPRTWRSMDRHARKSWYRENDLRRSKGLMLLSKPDGKAVSG